MILAIDPGEKNYAYSYINIIDYTFKTGTLKNTVRNLKKDKTQLFLTLYVEELSKIIQKINLNEKDIVIVERWTPRGARQGTMAETINIMIGSLFTLISCDFELVSASTWKNWFNRNYKTKDQQIWDLIQNPTLTDHQADTIGISAWYMETVLNMENSWNKLLKKAINFEGK